ncbi:copper amine oxidase N-terminal domain-containing protein [Lysinibacillus sp. NPDC056959]|uniref:copper amine oxidase N-terminal domain-containing protein n=1 Tax=Lysinibacillus sp. NPDC056959 TaxID=3345981 RepID=UPI00362995EE
MKRLVVCCLIVVIATFHFGTGNSTVYASVTENYIYNGKVVNGRLYAPIRAVSEKIKAQVNWNGATKTATLIKDKKVIKMTLGSKILKVNNEEIQMDVSLLLDNGSIFLPIRFIGDALEYKTNWNKNNRIGSLYSEQEQSSTAVFAQPLYYEDGYKLLDEAIAKVKNVSTVAQKRQYLKPYFTDEMINLIIMRNLTFTDKSKERDYYSYSYPKETNMSIRRQVVPVSGKFGYSVQIALLTKRNNQWVVGSLEEIFVPYMP